MRAGQGRSQEGDALAFVSTRATLETTRRFYVRHPGWLIVQLGLVAIPLLLGITGFFMSPLGPGRHPGRLRIRFAGYLRRPRLAGPS